MIMTYLTYSKIATVVAFGSATKTSWKTVVFSTKPSNCGMWRTFNFEANRRRCCQSNILSRLIYWRLFDQVNRNECMASILNEYLCTKNSDWFTESCTPGKSSSLFKVSHVSVWNRFCWEIATILGSSSSDVDAAAAYLARSSRFPIHLVPVTRFFVAVRLSVSLSPASLFRVLWM